MTAKTEQQNAILVVDDEADIRLLLKNIPSLRHEVKTAADGLEARELIERAPEAIDLVLTYLRMSLPTHRHEMAA